MKKVIIIAIILVACLLAVFIWRGGVNESIDQENTITGEDVTRETKEAMQTTIHYTAQQKDEYLRALEDDLRNIDERMAALKDRAAVMGGEARRELEKQLESLKEKRNAASGKLERLKTASGMAWKEMKEDTDTSVKDLKDTFSRIVSRFKE